MSAASFFGRQGMTSLFDPTQKSLMMNTMLPRCLPKRVARGNNGCGLLCPPGSMNVLFKLPGGIVALTSFHSGTDMSTLFL
jgi:hypothetical protein